MRQQYSKDFKQDAVVYVQTHPELSVAQCARNLGVNENTLHNLKNLPPLSKMLIEMRS